MKTISVPAQKKGRVVVSRFDGGMSNQFSDNILPLRYAKELFNLDTKNGGLLPGIGLSLVSLSHLSLERGALLLRRLSELENPSFLFHFKRLDESGERADFLIALCGSRIVAVDLFEPENANRVVWTTFLGDPIAVNYNLSGTDVLILCSKETKMIVWDGINSAYQIEDAPDISSMTLHYERLFATSSGEEQNSVWFSDDLDPTNWTLSLYDAGFVKMVDERGAALRVVDFLDYVYVFREYGISRISGYGDQTQFLVSGLSTQTGKIYPKTVTVCGSKIYFLAEDGAYSFDGLSAKKILPELSGFLAGADNQTAVAVSGEGKWYLLCNFALQANGETTDTRVLVELDTQTGKVCIAKDTGVIALCALRFATGSKVLAVAEVSGVAKVLQLDHSGAVLGTSLAGKWVSPWTTLGSMPGAKTVLKASLLKDSSCSPTLKIESDLESQETAFSDGEQQSIKAVRVSGSRFRFVLETDSSTANVEELAVEFCYKNR